MGRMGFEVGRESPGAQVDELAAKAEGASTIVGDLQQDRLHLDKVLAAVWPIARDGDVAAVEAAVRLVDQKAKLADAIDRRTGERERPASTESLDFIMSRVAKMEKRQNTAAYGHAHLEGRVDMMQVRLAEMIDAFGRMQSVLEGAIKGLSAPTNAQEEKRDGSSS